MPQQYTLETYHLNPVRSGQILRTFIEQSPYSQRQTAELIGISYDTLTNSLAGRSQQLSLEKAFKVCVLTGHSMEEYLRLLIADDPVDFADRIVYSSDYAVTFTEPIRENDDISVQTSVQTSVQPQNTESHPSFAMDYFMEQMALAQERVMDRYKGIHDTYTQQLVTQQQKELQMLDNRYESSVKHLKAQIKRLERKNSVLTIVLVLENIALAGVLLLDALNRDMGWIRSFFHSGGLMTLTKS